MNPSKKSIWFTFLILLISASLLLHFYFGLFTPYNYVTAHLDAIRGKYKILQYGEPMFTDQQAVKVATQFGFEYNIVAGCVVSEPEVNGIESYNAVMKNKIAQKNGENWEKVFQDAADSLFIIEREDIIRKVILAQPAIAKFVHYLDSVSNGKEQLHIEVKNYKTSPNAIVGVMRPDSSKLIMHYYYVSPYSLDISEILY